MDHAQPQLSHNVSTGDQYVYYPRRRDPLIESIKSYYWLTKPGIVYGNCLTAIAGFLLAAKIHLYALEFISMVAGIALVMASACVFNNYLDRSIDSLMRRTRKRALVRGSISTPRALTFGTLLGSMGLLILALGTNFLTTFIALSGMVTYVAVYGFWKRHSVHGTVVGSVAGAVPPVVGYTAVTNQLDLGALLLFIILVVWQMPHFYAIAMFRFEDYKAAGIPVLPVTHGMKTTQVQIVMYIVAFIAATSALSIAGYTGYTFAVIMALLGLIWLIIGLQDIATKDHTHWGRTMFKTSLIVLVMLSIMLSVGRLLP